MVEMLFDKCIKFFIENQILFPVNYFGTYCDTSNFCHQLDVKYPGINEKRPLSWNILYFLLYHGIARWLVLWPRALWLLTMTELRQLSYFLHWMYYPRWICAEHIEGKAQSVANMLGKLTYLFKESLQFRSRLTMHLWANTRLVMCARPDVFSKQENKTSTVLWF